MLRDESDAASRPLTGPPAGSARADNPAPRLTTSETVRMGANAVRFMIPR